MTAACPEAYISLAERLADASGVVIRKYFRTALAIEGKHDHTPVTVADREAETAIRDILAADCPDHGVYGEEHGIERADAEYVWVLDPIDGTKSFVCGVPIFGTLIALLRNGAPILGVIDQPILAERWIGAAGRDSTLNGAKIETRADARLGDARLSTTAPDYFAGTDAAAFERLKEAAGQMRYGGDCYAYGLLAAGFIDLVAEVGLKPYDYCALVPVIERAGGCITDWSGQPLGLESDGRVLASANPALHNEALALLR